jgi:hypothetical protein
MSPDGKANNQMDHVLIVIRQHSNIVDVSDLLEELTVIPLSGVTKVRQRLSVSKQASQKLHV